MHDGPTDGELVARVRGGDVEAYAELIRRHQASAIRLAALVTHDPTEAEDVAQEAFIKAYYALDRFKPDASFRAWLVRIVVNEARNARSAAQRRTTLSSRTDNERWGDSVARSAEDSAVANELRSALLIAVDQLRDDDRAVLAYRYLFDLSEAEMAQALDCRPGTVKSRLSRSLERLRENLRRVAPLLVVPELGTLLARDLPDALLPVGAGARPDMAATVLGTIAGGAAAGAAGAAAGVPGRPSVQQVVVATAGGGVVVVAIAVAALLVSVPRVAEPAASPAPTVGVPATSAPHQVASPAPAAAASAPVGMTIYGGDLSDEQRSELSAWFGSVAAGASRTVSRPELVSSLQAAGISVDGSERAISSVRVECLNAGAGLRVRTHNITEIPAAAYANALVSAGIADASVLVAAPSSAQMSGETALVGMLRAYPTCHPDAPPQPERERRAFDHLRLTADLAAANAAWDRAAAAVLRATQEVITSGVSDEASVGGIVDRALTAEGLTSSGTWRSRATSVLSELASAERGAYARGYDMQQLSTNEVLVQIKPAR